MGVDTMTYRARIGTFKHAFGHDVVTHDVFVDISLLRRIILTELLCSLLLMFALLEYSFLMKLPHEYMHTIDGSILYYYHVSYPLGQPTLHFTMEVIGYTMLLVAVFPDKHSTESGKYNVRRTDVSKSNGTKLNTLRYMLTGKNISSVLVIGSVIFIDMLLLMAGVEPNPGPNGGEVQGRNEETEDHPLLKRLGLSKYHPGKIELFHVLIVNNEQFADLKDRKIEDLPWILLRKLVFLNDTAFCLDEPNEEQSTDTDLEEDSSDDGDATYESEEINYLDVFLLTYQCCSPRMQQLLFQKMFLCRFAVPFLIRPIHGDKPVISMWPLRFLVCETYVKGKGVYEENVFDLPLKCAAFGRIGRPKFSKSQMLNRLVSDASAKTFFNIDCQSGQYLKKYCPGYIETFWLLRAGSDKDIFDDTTMFLNMRGCLISEFEQPELSFVGKFVDAITIFIDIEEYNKNMERKKNQMFTNLANLFKSVIFVIIEHSASKINRPDDRNACKIRFVRIFDKKMRRMKRDDEIKKNISMHVKEIIKNKESVSLKKRFERSLTPEIITDEDFEACLEGKRHAVQLFDTMCQDEKFLTLKKSITPIQSKIARRLGQLLKELKREKHSGTQEETRAEIKVLREDVLNKVSDSIKRFIKYLCSVSSEEMYYFLEWLKLEISRKCKCEQFQLNRRHRKAWDTFHQTKNEQADQQFGIKEIMQIESDMDAASFSVGHLFREVGLIYDTICELKQKEENLPPVEKIASIIGNLTVNGHQLEIIDGDSFYLPQMWLSKIFNSIDKNIKVITLSILGVQSSGKSTLLNTMFGALFSTRAGRCTRGIHAQIIPLNGEFDSTTTPSECILVLDTEGLRSTDVTYKDYEHDNEMATLITGLGDVTLVNVMGENTQEIRDILQTVAHAFLRLKLANKSLNIDKRCEIIQQNITSTSASGLMNDGLQKLIKHLDEMTLDSARCEGIHDIRSFNEVIQFDPKSNVWYLSHVWDGNPPFARVNRDYSEKVTQIKLSLFKQFYEQKIIPYKTLQDFIIHTGDLWRGVVNENFVFSFKNSIERRAYLHMDEWIQDMLWEIESCSTDKIREAAQEEFSTCDKREDIDTSLKKVRSRATELINCKRNEAGDNLKTYFDTCGYRIIVNQWKENQRGRLHRFFDHLGDIAEDIIQKQRDKQETKLLLRFNIMERELSFQNKLLDYAKLHPVNTMDIEATDNLFERYWSELFSNQGPTKKAHSSNLKHIFQTNLRETYEGHLPVLQSILEQISDKANSKSQVSLSFDQTMIDTTDTNLSYFRKCYSGSKYNKNEIQNHVDLLFKAFDWKIKAPCQTNDQMSEPHIRDLFRYMKDKIKKNKLDVHNSFYIKIYVHVSLVAENIFNKHNVTILKKRNAELETSKRQHKVLFEKIFKLRQTEDTLAEIITDVIHEYIKDESVAQFSNKILDVLRGHLPRTKHLLIIELCTYYVNEKNFSEIVYYIHHPLEAALKWLENRANTFIFEGKPNSYSSNNIQIVNALLLKVTNILDSLSTTDNVTITTLQFVSELRYALSKNKLFISITDFESVLRCDDGAEVNLRAVCDAVTNKLNTLITQLIDSFPSCTKDTIWWRERSPIQNMLETIWGCTELCPYCREPCDKSSKEHDDDHMCVQHRPKCCRGTRTLGTEIASSNTCSYAVQSDLAHTCGACNYICNDGENNCQIKWHAYKNYRQICQDWFIPPSSDMYDSSGFWLWFVGTFKDRLAEEYNYKIDEIPGTWSKISQQDAIESLRIYCSK